MLWRVRNTEREGAGNLLEASLDSHREILSQPKTWQFEIIRSIVNKQHSCETFMCLELGFKLADLQTAAKRGKVEVITELNSMS